MYTQQELPKLMEEIVTLATSLEGHARGSLLETQYMLRHYPRGSGTTNLVGIFLTSEAAYQCSHHLSQLSFGDYLVTPEVNDNREWYLIRRMPSIIVEQQKKIEELEARLSAQG